MMAWPYLLLIALLFPQDATSPSVIPLHPSAETGISIAWFRSWGATQCDARGNLYFRIGENLNRAAIRRLASDATSATYTLPSDDAETTFYQDFRATADGEVHILASDHDGRLHVFSFQSDSTDNPLHVRLDAPPNLHPTAFAVFPSGTILISGFFGKDADEPLHGKPYAAAFDASGRLMTTIDTHARSLDVAKPPPALGSTTAMDSRGTLYLVQEDELLVMSETGEIQRKIHLAKPAPEYRIGHIQVAGARVALWFMKAESRRPVILRLGILDPLSGSVSGFYEPDAELGNNAPCFTGDAFLFGRVRNGFLRIVKASVR